ncbi:hypothetical protein [Fibrella aquatica]|uniref:hypothetical protein n=1 Tax=Fibrella aquatica TaxID=3242487 RepID=UPI003521D797
MSTQYNPNVIRIDNSLELSTIEGEYEKLQSRSNVDLHISIRTNTNIFGTVPAIIQLAIFWNKQSTEGIITIDINDESEIEKLYELDYVFPIIVHCWSRQIKNKGGSDLKSVLRKYNNEQNTKMKNQDNKGFKILLSCFDHLSTSKGLINSFYTDNEFIENEMLFEYAIQKALKGVLQFNRQLSVANIGPIYGDIVEIIYELIKNTHDWATTDSYNKPLNPSTRGLYLKFHRGKTDNFASAYRQHLGLYDYFTGDNFVENTINELYFLEISVYDSGIGFVQRFNSESSESTPVNEQVEIIKKCMLLNSTSATGIPKTFKGKGLDRIMNILNKKGFLWIRTASVSLFRNLQKNNLMQDQKVENTQLYDWFTNSTTNFSTLTAVKGSVITIVYPISTTRNA